MKRTLIAQVRQLAGNRCDYCHMPAEFDPLPFQFDHVIARQHGGLTVLENSAWSCLHCNKHKGPNIAGLEPVTGKLVALFHPRLHDGIAIFKGDTLEEARENLREAVTLVLDANRELAERSLLGQQVTREPFVLAAS